MSAVFTNTRFWWSTSNSFLISVHHKDLKIPVQDSVWGSEGRRTVDFGGGCMAGVNKACAPGTLSKPLIPPQGPGCEGDSGL